MVKLTNERFVALLAVLIVVETIASPVGNAKRSVETLVTGWNNRQICLTDSCITTAISLLSSVDRNVKPCENFYKFACGNWHVENPLPSANHQWSQFSIMARQMHDKVKDILQSPITPRDIEAVKKGKMSYHSCMDEGKIDEMRLDGIENILRENGGWPLAMRVNTWTERKITWQEIHNNYLNLGGVSALFDIAVFPDFTETNRKMIWVKKPVNFRLPRAQLAVLNGNARLMHVYTKYIWTIVHSMTEFVKAGGYTKPLLISIRQMIDFEIRLADITLVFAPEDVDASKSVVTIEEFQAFYDSAKPKTLTAKINWLETIRNTFADSPEITIDAQEVIRMPNKGYTRALVELLNSTPEETVVNYIHWKLIDKLLVHTTRATRKDVYRFLKETTGLNYDRPREELCVTQTGLDHAIGFAYVNEEFSSSAKARAENLMKQIQKAMSEQIENSSWLDPRTMMLAKEKLDYMADLIGFPDWYTESGLNNYYKDLAVGPVYITNVLNRWKFTLRENHKELRAPLDRKKWPVTPTTTNAYYNIPTNAVIIPAAILRIPFFDPQRPEVVNYGSIGAIIGHEISHGFDDMGRRFDKDGNGHQWWADSVIEEYQKKTECFVEQFNEYKIYESANETIYADGRQSLGENIADSIGFELAHSAYEQWEKNIRKEQRHDDFTLPRHEEYTNDQLFFLSLANMWCAADSDTHLKDFAPKDRHSIPSLRVIGALSNMKSFSDAFNCPVGSPMNPSRKCSIWQ